MAYVKICTVILFKNLMPLLEVELIIYPTKETSLCSVFAEQWVVNVYIEPLGNIQRKSKYYTL